ncbi:CBS domain-containing protein [Actinacidiphila bryophytorum]|uniref:CBS domain-containing protein n=1 Tax=Actinacidiphila bryophytorum TaxID=1436133 RepID=A0A9W4GY97_9ACTN|nr:CBS domain-containing protein [Actinacidiphila bryophytorum]MBM9438407.1 CBS domain-containing protein [Actinacidiphila bryophytorum]MBN6542319.1 CBS domain-containing protein [Actinacidiphila bryophytorum]CAG7613916.1 CBS domain-containing protein [Actinacidiphila bryophytorum]
MTGSPHIIRDVMTAAVVSVDRDAQFKEIVRVLQQRNVSAVPVVRADGVVVGVVSEADLLPKEEFRDSEPSRLTQLGRLNDILKAGSVVAGDLMTAPAVTVEADDTLSQAARIMAEAKVKRLPVVDSEGRLRGIVSRGDLLKVFLRADEDLAEEVRREIVGYLFPGEPSPVRVQVTDGAVTLSGSVTDTARVPVASQLVRSVEGVVDVRWDLDQPQRRTPP